MAGGDLRDLLDRFGLTPAAVGELLAELEAAMSAEIAAIDDEHLDVVPVLDFAAVAAGEVPDAAVDRIRRRGCAVMRGTFERGQAEDWDRSIADYLSVNRFDDRYAERYPDATEASRIWGIYWSKPQVEARQHTAMAAARRFLNSLWRHDAPGGPWFDPEGDIGYPDRIRRRAPGVRSRGLAPHCDAASSGGWRLAENTRVFRSVLEGRVDEYDAWDASHRTTAEVDPAAPSSVFRSFQGWTALSEMHPTDGVLHVIPVPAAAAYLLVRGIAGDLGLLDDDATESACRLRADEVLLRAMRPIPPVAPGDTVWWHGDLVHSVADATNEDRWGNVMYIGAAPRCARNDRYAATMLERLISGRSPADFPAEDFEVDFVGRAGIDDLDEIGRRQFGLEPVADVAGPSVRNGL